mmetsp:Transcript_20579/g.50571  ORF Transcript_20579/g.50571 Transcript_20579/m.50571 type:complete len:360 (-) Transcript_20579:578-1657(-)
MLPKMVQNVAHCAVAERLFRDPFHAVPDNAALRIACQSQLIQSCALVDTSEGDDKKQKLDVIDGIFRKLLSEECGHHCRFISPIAFQEHTVPCVECLQVGLDRSLVASSVVMNQRSLHQGPDRIGRIRCIQLLSNNGWDPQCRWTPTVRPLRHRNVFARADHTMHHVRLRIAGHRSPAPDCHQRSAPLKAASQKKVSKLAFLAQSYQRPPARRKGPLRLQWHKAVEQIAVADFDTLHHSQNLFLSRCVLGGVWRTRVHQESARRESLQELGHAHRRIVYAHLEMWRCIDDLIENFRHFLHRDHVRHQAQRLQERVEINQRHHLLNFSLHRRCFAFPLFLLLLRRTHYAPMWLLKCISSV